MYSEITQCYNIIFVIFTALLSFFLLVTLAQCDIVFLAMLLPFPILITTALFSVCFLDMSHPANDQNNQCKKEKNQKSNKQSVNIKDELNEEIIDDEDSEDICMSILTYIKALLCILILYECQFNFIEHQPFGSLLCRGILATVLRVQCSLIIISMHVLPEKIVASLVDIYNQRNIEDDFPEEKACSDSILNFFHVMRFRTLKHKAGSEQKLETCFKQNFKFQKEIKKPYLFCQEL